MSSSLRHIRLELAREPEHPLGEAGIGYDLVAFLDDEGRLDPAAWRANPDRCRVRRFMRDETALTGRLRHEPGHRWILDFPGDSPEDAAGFRLDQERFTPGEYVSIAARDGQAHTYRVARVAEV